MHRTNNERTTSTNNLVQQNVLSQADLHDRCAVADVCERSWALVYAHSAEGVAWAGSKKKLMDDVIAGKDVKVSFLGTDDSVLSLVASVVCVCSSVTSPCSGIRRGRSGEALTPTHILLTQPTHILLIQPTHTHHARSSLDPYTPLNPNQTAILVKP